MFRYYQAAVLFVFPVTLPVMSLLVLVLLAVLSRNPVLLSREGAVRGGGTVLTSWPGQETRPTSSALLKCNR